MIAKLNASQKHVLRIVHRDQDRDGNVRVHEQLYNALVMNIPKQLMTFTKLNMGGIAKLTKEGRHVVEAMKWL